MTLAERIQAPGPKKILALDGSGIRGMRLTNWWLLVRGGDRPRTRKIRLLC